MNTPDLLEDSPWHTAVGCTRPCFPCSCHASRPFPMPSCGGTLQAPHSAVLCLVCCVLCHAVLCLPSQLSHHDLKPDNIGYDPSQRRFVLWDFGLASRFGQEPVGACYQYAAPEVGEVGWGFLLHHRRAWCSAVSCGGLTAPPGCGFVQPAVVRLCALGTSVNSGLVLPHLCWPLT